MGGTPAPIATLRSSVRPTGHVVEPRRRRRWLVLVLVPVSIVLLGVRLWLASEDGRSGVARLIEHFASQGIRGSVVVGRLDDVSLGGVVGHDIRFLDESGASCSPGTSSARAAACTEDAWCRRPSHRAGS